VSIERYRFKRKTGSGGKQVPEENRFWRKEVLKEEVLEETGSGAK
jgi:hypothetical protein